MKQSSNLCISEVDGRGALYGDRLKRARESIGKSHQEIATVVGIPLSTYYEMEEHAGMLNRQTSLRELSNLSRALGIQVKRLFEDEDEKGQSVLPEQLCAKITTHLAVVRVSVAEFEDRVGFEIEPALRNPSEVLNWNVDCLRFVCQEITVDWLAALP